MPEGEVLRYIKTHWPKEKYNSFIAKNPSNKPFLKDSNFNFKEFIADNINILIMLSLSIFLVYFNAFDNGFVSDDVQLISKNPRVGDFTFALTQSLVGSVRNILYFFSFHLGGLNPAFFRVINIAFHLGSSFLAFAILNFLTNKKLIAIFASLLFAIHPIMAESITWISGGPYSQYGFFLLLSFFLYLISGENKKIYWVAVLAFAFSLLSSEKSMVFFAILFVYEISAGKLKDNWKKIIPFFSMSLLLIIMYAARIGGRIADLESTTYQDTQSINLFVQIPIATSSYLKLIFWPDKLSLYQTEMFFSTFQYIIFLSVFFLFLAFIFYGWKKNKAVFFWLSFFIITLSPTLTPFKISWIVAERYVYLGSLGIFVVIALFFNWLIEKYSNRKNIIYSVFAILIVLLSARTIVRNMDWQNEDTLWLATAKTSPSGQNIHNNLGDVYGRQKNYEKAVEEFKKAVEINPNYADAYHNLGNTYIEMGKIEEALESYQKAVSINPNLWQSYQNIAAIYFERGNYQKSYEMIKKAAETNPNDPNIQGNLKIIESKLNSTK